MITAEPLAQQIARATIDGAVHIPLHLLQPSSTNPRTHFDEPKLQELAKSIRQHGLMQPILVRPLPDAVKGEALYEIVAGERRWRASKLAEDVAGVGRIMAIVREMTDFQVLELQLVENLQREDLHPLEEADGYERLLRKPDGVQGFANVDELAARIGKSRSYVFQRLKLRALGKEGREAFLKGELSASVALLIARLQLPTEQATAVKHIVNGWGGSALSYRQAAEWIHRQFMLDLNRAVFKIADATLLPTAGSCTACPKRTGANPDLFQDVDNADTCTDPTCYQEKELAHRESLKAQAQEAGRQVIDGAEAKKIKPQAYGELKGFVKVDETDYKLGDKPLRKLLGKGLAGCEVVAFEDPHTHTVYDVVRQADAVKALKDKGLLKTNRMPTNGAAQRETDAKIKAEKAWRAKVAERVLQQAKGSAGERAAFRTELLTQVALALWQHMNHEVRGRVEKLLGWESVVYDYNHPDRARNVAQERLRGLTDGALAAYFTAAAIAGDLAVNGYELGDKKRFEAPPHLTLLAGLLGVDVRGIKAELAGPAKPVTPLKALGAAVKKASSKLTGKEGTVYLSDAASDMSRVVPA